MTNISEHKWSDSSDVICLTRVKSDNILLDVDRGVLEIDARDAIAIAKHFELFSSDVLINEM